MAYPTSQRFSQLSAQQRSATVRSVSSSPAIECRLPGASRAMSLYAEGVFRSSIHGWGQVRELLARRAHPHQEGAVGGCARGVEDRDRY